MKSHHTKTTFGQRALHVALAAAAAMALCRIGQLAAGSKRTPAPTTAIAQSKAPSQNADAELAQLYAACPMSATIDLQTATTAAKKTTELLPPYRPLANRVPVPPSAPPLPRIRYPIPVGSSTVSAPGDFVRVAQAPRVAKSEAGPSSDWLIEPSEWYTPEEHSSKKHESNNPPAATTAADAPATPASIVGGVSDADPAPAAQNIPVEDPEHSSSGESPQQPPPAAQNKPVTETPPMSEPRPLFPPPATVGELPSPNNEDRGRGRPGSQPPEVPPATPPNVDPRLALFAKNAYPSARECAQCHEEIYHDWSVSAHAYAAVSPMFHKFEQKLNDLTNGTVGYFCMRCHAPVATDLCAPRDEPLWKLPEVAREGITCIACHRVQYVYGKSNGERRIEPGNVFAPVLGGIGGDGVAETIHRKNEFKVKTSPDEPGPGQNIHAAGIYFEPLTRSEFCTPCHQVAVHPGIKLEVVWEQYRASPACKKGIQCQDCHMGRVPGLPLGYDCGPVARMADKTVNDQRKKSNHIFYGPNYSIAHPGVFPFHLKADRWTMDQWLTFDWRAGWGTKEFEARVAKGQVQACFPPVWAEADDRYDAREIIDENFKKLARKRDVRVQVMENGSHVEGPFFAAAPCRGQDLNFHYVVTNTNEGHNLLTASLGAQPQLWANVVLIGPDGTRLWETGYTDSYGDLANIHSEDVRHHRTPYDYQLFNLQTMFLISGAKGTDREFFVPVNIETDPLPFIRPGVQPISVINHPPTIRMESRSLAPLGSRQAFYHIPGRLVQQPGTYRLSFRLRSRSEPPYFMRFCGATEEMLRAENEWMIDVHPMTVEFVVR